jgi:hypothetical protein
MQDITLEIEHVKKIENSKISASDMNHKIFLNPNNANVRSIRNTYASYESIIWRKKTES